MIVQRDESAIGIFTSQRRTNGIDPEAWLADILRRIGDHRASRLDELLPWNWKPPAGNLAAAA